VDPLANAAAAPRSRPLSTRSQALPGMELPILVRVPGAFCQLWLVSRVTTVEPHVVSWKVGRMSRTFTSE
jgi:hypothetical protein